MPLSFASINSGSNGNCYYVGNSVDSVLIDAGLSCREIERRMKRLSLSVESLKGILVSHEHTDHIKGVETLVKKYSLPLFISEDTLRHSNMKVAKDKVVYLQPDMPIDIGSLHIVPFTKMHDASDPYSFTVSSLHKTIGVFTDIGIVCENMIRYFKQCHAAFLEANYDEEMLENGNYPYHLKVRIKGGKGHLSNKQAFELFCKYKHPKLSHLILSHLSKHNNHPALVHNLFTSTTHANSMEIIVASRYEESAVYSLFDEKEKKQSVNKPQQLMLW